MISITIRETRIRWQKIFWVIHGHTGSSLWSLECRQRFGTHITTLGGYAEKFVFTNAGKCSWDNVLCQVSDVRVWKLHC